MRWYVVHPGGHAGPFVLLETPDEHEARDRADGWSGAAVSGTDALEDDRYQAVIAAWEAREDEAYLAWRTEEEAEAAIVEAATDAEVETLVDPSLEEVADAVERADDRLSE